MSNVRELEAVEDDWFVEGRLVLPESLHFDAWLLIGQQLQRMQRSVSWWVGDWMLYGEGRYGERFSQALDATGYAKHSIQNAASVAKAIPPSRRRELVPFSHHAEVVSLPPAQQDELLAQVEKEDMPVAKLRAKVRHIQAVTAGVPESYGWTMRCRTCSEDGPYLDTQPGQVVFDRAFLARWLGEHQRHDVALLGQERTAPVGQ